MSVIQRFTHFYQCLDGNSVSNLSHLYADTIEFTDPIGQYQGLPSLQQYFSALLENTQKCQCEINSVIANATDDDGEASFTWVMTVIHPKLNHGNSIRVDGASVIRFRHGKIDFHRDYYDMGQMLYENVFALKSIIHFIKNRLH